LAPLFRFAVTALVPHVSQFVVAGRVTCWGVPLTTRDTVRTVPVPLLYRSVTGAPPAEGELTAKVAMALPRLASVNPPT
jgi:hypothetical protein